MTDIIFSRDGASKGMVSTNTKEPAEVAQLVSMALYEADGAFRSFGEPGDTITVGSTQKGLTPGGRLLRMCSAEGVALDDASVMERVTVYKITSNEAWGELVEADIDTDPMALTNLVMEDIGEAQKDGLSMEGYKEPFADMATSSFIVLTQRKNREV